LPIQKHGRRAVADAFIYHSLLILAALFHADGNKTVTNFSFVVSH
jgi:hypothetical protein